MTQERGEPFGPYLVYEQLGVGGMAHVHRAEQVGIEGFRKVVALKRMLPNVAASDELVQAFVREARLASFLRHPNVAQTHELGKVGDTYFIAMELIEGKNLRDVLRLCAGNGKLMPVAIALVIINQICDALDYAHNLCDDDNQPLGIIHRDVSPSNIIVAEGGLVKLIDFGIAKASAAGMQTMSGMIKGKFGYMAPEYIDGRIDARADLFAVGVIAHELLTNRPLFTSGDEMDTLHRVRSMPIEPPSRRNPDVPSEIDDIVMTALARDPDLRWQHATALHTAMTTVTKRLGLAITHQQLGEWLDQAFFDLPTLPFGMSAYPSDDDPSISISVENLPAAGAPASPGHEPPSSQKVTLMLRGSNPRSSDEYAAAVASYERHDALVPTGSFLADEIVPTVVRSSSPRLELPVTPAPAPAAPSAPTAPPAPTGFGPVRGTSRTTAVVLVLLAAALSAAAVYFLLPLVTT